MATQAVDPRQVVAYRAANPCLTLKNVGLRFHGISRERVRQILAKHGAPTRARRPPPLMVPLVCDHCGTLFERKQKTVLDRARTRKYRGAWVACSPSCSRVQLQRHMEAINLANRGYRKPVCKRGHPRTPENLYRSGACRQCLALANAAYRRRKTASTRLRAAQ